MVSWRTIIPLLSYKHIVLKDSVVPSTPIMHVLLTGLGETTIEGLILGFSFCDKIVVST